MVARNHTHWTRLIFYITDTIQTLKHSCITTVTLCKRIRAVFRAIQPLCYYFFQWSAFICNFRASQRYRCKNQTQGKKNPWCLILKNLELRKFTFMFPALVQCYWPSVPYTDKAGDGNHRVVNANEV